MNLSRHAAPPPDVEAASSRVGDKVSAVVKSIMADKKLYRESLGISRKRGNGTLSREVWVDEHTGQVTRYNLAYINHAIYALDNGRVVGYDNAHGFHHRHYRGTVEPVSFISYEDIEQRFEREWQQLREES